MKQYIIGEDVLKPLLQYLSGKPYGEVYQGISRLQALSPYNPDEQRTDKAKNKKQGA